MKKYRNEGAEARDAIVYALKGIRGEARELLQRVGLQLTPNMDEFHARCESGKCGACGRERRSLTGRTCWRPSCIAFRKRARSRDNGHQREGLYWLLVGVVAFLQQHGAIPRRAPSWR